MKLSADDIFLIFIILSLCSLAIAGFFALRRRKLLDEKKHVLTALHIMTIGVFFACVFIHLPIYYRNADLIGPYHNIRPLLMSVLASLQTFVLNLGFPEILKSLSEMEVSLDPTLSMVYSFCLAALYILAPILTLSNIFSLFRNFTGELRVKFNHSKPMYIFSELNAQSIATAESIYRRYLTEKKERGHFPQFGKRRAFRKAGKKLKKPLIVFTDVFTPEEEGSKELMQKARGIKAVCLETDITRLNVPKGSIPMEFFLIGMNESENIEQTIKLNESCRDFTNRSVYVFSSKSSAGAILDSVDKGKMTVSPSTEAAVISDTKGFLGSDSAAESVYSVEDCYYIRRIDSINSLAVNTLTDKALLTPLIRAAKDKRMFSVMFVGLGHYGEAFLTNALWLFQIYGFRLCINIIDTADSARLIGKLRRRIPELDKFRVDTGDDSCVSYHLSGSGVDENGDDYYGESCFDIRVFPSVDCESAGLSDLFIRESEKYELYRKLPDNKKPKASDEAGMDRLPGIELPGYPYQTMPIEAFHDTQLAVVALGEDDRNIEIALELRRQFDRLKKVSEKSVKNDPDELPLIYSIVYDDRTANNISACSDRRGLINCKGTPFHIRFVGQMSSQYDYSIIEHMKKTENSAVWRHFEWIKNEDSLRSCYYINASVLTDPVACRMIADFRNEMDDYFKNCCGGKEQWDIEYVYTGGEPDTEKILGDIRAYSDYEYFRESSVAKAVHQELIKDYFADYFTIFDRGLCHRDTVDVCSCDKCTNLRITEHMRWNAYMRAHRFTYFDKNTRNDRAGIHFDLVPWNKLKAPERYKD